MVVYATLRKGLLVASPTQPVGRAEALVLRKRVLRNALFITGASCTGDMVCQGLETKGELLGRWDSSRTLRMGLTGFFVVTPTSFAWHTLAERLSPGTHWGAMLGKLVVQMAVMPVMIASQFTALVLLEGGTLGDVARKLKRDMLPTASSGLCYWPFVGLLQYRFVPVVNRPAWGSFAGVWWNIYLSFMANNGTLDIGEPVFAGAAERLMAGVGVGDAAVAAGAPPRAPLAPAPAAKEEGEADTGNAGLAGEGERRRRPSKVLISRRTTVVSM